MGLDQAAFSKPPDKQMKFEFDPDADEVEEKVLEITDWRKHNRLQGWMENLWHEKGCPRPPDEVSPPPDAIFGNNSFNCIDLELTATDIDDLEAAIKNMTFPETGGFFFGDDSYSWDCPEDDDPNDYFYKDKDLEFVKVARERLAAGHKVYYTCWW
tara:strand:+ start:93 stop:560 length:468 start_codon:yes stop_codon:yes gene_type:complete